MTTDDRNQRTLTGLRTSWFGRSLEVTGLTAKLAAKSIGGKLSGLVSSDDQAKQRGEASRGRELADSLGALKGAAMKVGQMISYIDLSLSEPMRDALAELQDRSPPMEPAAAARVIEAELGRPPSELFAEWEPQAFAAASIGQVHRARLQDGTAVAVKVQYPGIVDVLQSDLKNTAVLRVIGPLMGLGNSTSKSLIEEFTNRLMEECDYEHELQATDLFRRLWAGEPSVVIPQTFPEYSTRRVLTTEFIEGLGFRDFIEQATQAQRNAAGEALFRVAFESIFKHGVFNCDPHPGNYLFQPERVAFLDFGCTRQFEDHRVAAWRQLIRSVLAEDMGSFRAAIDELGFARPGKRFDYDQHFKVSTYLYEPWLRDEPFQYTSDYVRKSFTAILRDNPNLRNTGMPQDFTFVNRLQWGLNSVLAMLGAEANWHRILLPLVGREPA